MSIIEDFQNMFSVAGQKAKQTVDIKILIHKIRGYEKELKDCYIAVGKALYFSRKESQPPDEALVAAMFENIDSLTYRINLLSKQIDQLRRQQTGKGQRREPFVSEALAPPGSEDIDEKYFKLSMKEDDLKIRRTVEGIKAVRVCPVCSAANDPADETCAGCGNVLRTNH